MKTRNYKHPYIWYPEHEDTLIQTIHDCDVDWQYNGFIYNPALNKRKSIESLKDAELECERRNALIEAKAVSNASQS